MADISAVIKAIGNFFVYMFQNEVFSTIVISLLVLVMLCHLMVILLFLMDHNIQREKERETAKKLNIDKNSKICYTKENKK